MLNKLISLKLKLFYCRRIKDKSFFEIGLPIVFISIIILLISGALLMIMKLTDPTSRTIVSFGSILYLILFANSVINEVGKIFNYYFNDRKQEILLLASIDIKICIALEMIERIIKLFGKYVFCIIPLFISYGFFKERAIYLTIIGVIISLIVACLNYLISMILMFIIKYLAADNIVERVVSITKIFVEVVISISTIMLFYSKTQNEILDIVNSLKITKASYIVASYFNTLRSSTLIVFLSIGIAVTIIYISLHLNRFIYSKIISKSEKIYVERNTKKTFHININNKYIVSKDIILLKRNIFKISDLLVMEFIYIFLLFQKREKITLEVFLVITIFMIVYFVFKITKNACNENRQLEILILAGINKLAIYKEKIMYISITVGISMFIYILLSVLLYRFKLIEVVYIFIIITSNIVILSKKVLLGFIAFNKLELTERKFKFNKSLLIVINMIIMYIIHLVILGIIMYNIININILWISIMFIELIVMNFMINLYGKKMLLKY